MPLILGHGYPGSIVDFIDLIGPLTDPRAHGGDPADAFDVVVPSIPGFGFSVPVSEPGWQQKRTAGAFTQLMARLGYERYGAHGYDIGGGIVGDLAKVAPDAVIGSHIATDVHAFAYLGFLPPSEDAGSDEERAYLDRLRADADGGTGYLKLTSTRPQTVAYARHRFAGLPAGLDRGEVQGVDEPFEGVARRRRFSRHAADQREPVLVHPLRRLGGAFPLRQHERGPGLEPGSGHPDRVLGLRWRSVRHRQRSAQPGWREPELVRA